MPGMHSEEAFEEAIEAWLVDHGGYQSGAASYVDPVLGIDTATLFEFIGQTQIPEWNRLIGLHGGADEAQRRFLARLAAQLDERGTLEVLRHGVEDLGVQIRLAYMRPSSGLNPTLDELYAANRLTVVRQLHLPSHPGQSVDLTLFVNGLPVATAELKNPLTGQSIDHAIRQYGERDGTDVVLRRCVVHFAVDPDQVKMATRLAGRQTVFLPFNQGSAGPGEPGGAGNPSRDGYATAYLWQEVWRRDPWLDLLARFVHEAQSEPGRKGRAARRDGKVIFPRFHQWHAVRALTAHAREHGAGHRYLVQHSAGSGKSNTIAWLAHRLANLHDGDDDKIFDKVVVITDRTVLDRQLQDTIYQFERTHGVVARIDTDSNQLAEALSGAEAKIVVTTLQKFPFVVDKVGDLTGRRFAVLIDEAHSSQGGDSATAMTAVLTGGSATPVAEVEAEADEPPDGQDQVAAALAAAVAARGPQANLSLFAFTATPKARTLEMFGSSPEGTSIRRATHVYSMRQAIEEGFILDVLRSYTTYATYYRIENAGLGDPEVDKKKAAAKIAAYVSLHDEVSAQKARIVVEHFRQHTAPMIGGRAKAMVVCRTRPHALHMYRAIRAYVASHGITDVSTLVAFSGTLDDPDTASTVSEAGLNGFPESETARRFATDEHQILVVAEKFQTGFDQPLLHTMFVDKPLKGVNAVQTLSRLNRTTAGKDSTFVLDFVNDAEAIKRAFEPFYDASSALPTDPNALFDARVDLDRYDVIRDVDVDALAAAWYRLPPVDRARSGAHEALYAHLDPALARFRDLDDDDQEAFRAALDRFVSLYTFVTQIVPLANTDLEKRYRYCRLLALRLPARAGVALDLDVALTHLRVAEKGREEIELTGDAEPLVAFPEDGGGSRYLPGFEPLSAVIARFNEAFGGQISEADRLLVEGLGARMVEDPLLQAQAVANDEGQFASVVEDRWSEFVADHMKGNEALLIRLLDEPDLADAAKAQLRPWLQKRARVLHDSSAPISQLLGRDESETLELKSTLRWDLKAHAKNRALEQASIKTVGAFLNSPHGGVLLIGVDDHGEVVGLQHDYATFDRPDHSDTDVFQLHLTQLLISAFGEAATSLVSVALHQVDDRDVARVHVEPAGFPVFQDVKGVRTLFVRLGNATRAVTDSAEIDRYVGIRWPRP
ncbi:DEAD/DEAH box helicase family protein [Iamia sp. SCSIO 61187]|uniref:DEAD/DEAH box helicase family protein n=1 Tax=Iamia sp. SCSIO 61187 TaxID=2722752 RepID=UPI001C62852F|nr:DEAD/DEAH box helicase family protein [Iamia sp. SCSIO 61187]QYG93775.1 DEAD/DEAH box helicase family protein [Iamia sp. SCSIO 61187]